MAFGGILLLNILLMILFGMAAVGIVCLLLSAILFIVHMVKKKQGKFQRKGKVAASVILLIVGIACMVIPTGAFLIFYPNDKIVVQTPDGEATVKETQAKSMELAIGSDDVEEVEKLIKKNPALLYCTWENLTPLGRAISSESVNVVAYLLESGVDVDQADNLNFDTTMTYAAKYIQQGTAENSFAVMKLLIDYGADLNKTHGSTPPVQYLIMYIVEDSSVSPEELDILEYFIKGGADLTLGDLRHDDAVDIFEAKVSKLELTTEQEAEFEAMRELLMKYYPEQKESAEE